MNKWYGGAFADAMCPPIFLILPESENDLSTGGRPSAPKKDFDFEVEGMIIRNSVILRVAPRRG